MRNLKISLVAFSLCFAGVALAAPPANVAGIWTLTVDSQLETLDLAQNAIAPGAVCARISGKISIAPVRGFYCPGTGRLYFHHANVTTQVTVRTFDGVVTDAANGLPMSVAGTFTVVDTQFGAFGDYGFSGTK